MPVVLATSFVLSSLGGVGPIGTGSRVLPDVGASEIGCRELHKYEVEDRRLKVKDRWPRPAKEIGNCSTERLRG